MISEFHLLSEKISRLAAMTLALRKENADFRMQIAALTQANAQLNGKIATAADRVSDLLQKFPEIVTEEDAAPEGVTTDDVNEEEAV